MPLRRDSMNCACKFTHNTPITIHFKYEVLHVAEDNGDTPSQLRRNVMKISHAVNTITLAMDAR